MLVRRTKEGESLWIGDSIEIRVIRTGRQITLGIIAPREMVIGARPVARTVIENTRAVLSISTLCELDMQIRSRIPLVMHSGLSAKKTDLRPIKEQSPES